MMTRDEAVAAIVAATNEYKATCGGNTARLLTPVRKEVTRLADAARKVKDDKIRALKKWIDVIDSGAVPKDPASENKVEVKTEE